MSNLIDIRAASFFACVPVAYIHQMIKAGNVSGSSKRKLVSLSSLKAHIETRKQR